MAPKCPEKCLCSTSWTSWSEQWRPWRTLWSTGVQWRCGQAEVSGVHLGEHCVQHVLDETSWTSWSERCRPQWTLCSTGPVVKRQGVQWRLKWANVCWSRWTVRSTHPAMKRQGVQWRLKWAMSTCVSNAFNTSRFCCCCSGTLWLWGSPGECTHTCTGTSTGNLHRVRGLRAQPFSITLPRRQPHSVFWGYPPAGKNQVYSEDWSERMSTSFNTSGCEVPGCKVETKRRCWSVVMDN